MPRPSDLPRLFRTAAACLLAALATGCVQPLAVQNEFYSPLTGTADRIGAHTELTVSHHRALQAAQRVCGTPLSAAMARDTTNHGASGPVPGSSSAPPGPGQSVRHPDPAARGRARRHVERIPAVGGGSREGTARGDRDRRWSRRRHLRGATCGRRPGVHRTVDAPHRGQPVCTRVCRRRRNRACPARRTRGPGGQNRAGSLPGRAPVPGHRTYPQARVRRPRRSRESGERGQRADGGVRDRYHADRVRLHRHRGLHP